jgi:hypothetical protein
MEKLLQEVLFVSTGIGEREEQLIHGGQVAAEICLCNEPKELKKNVIALRPRTTYQSAQTNATFINNQSYL